MKKNIQITLMATVTAFLLSACGGSSNNIDTSIKSCDSGLYTALKKGDKVVALTDDTKIKLLHKEDGTKEACVESGEAIIN